MGSIIAHTSKEMQHVSIIVPCYNYGWLLAETLESILAQTYANWECIIVDDGSTDSTREVAERYQKQDSRFVYVYQNNAGLSAARNTGLRHASGTYVQLLDADDLLASRKLATQTSLLDTRPEVDIVYGDVRYFQHDTPTVLSRSLNMQDNAWMVGMNGKGLPVLETLLKYNQFVVNAPLCRMSLLKKVGFFNEQLRSLEDWEYWLRCAIHGAYFHYQATPDVWAFVRVHSVSMSQNVNRMVGFVCQVREQMEKPLRKLGAKEALAINRADLCSILEHRAIDEMRQGRHSDSLRTFWKLTRITGRYTHYLRAYVYQLRRKELASHPMH